MFMRTLAERFRKFMFFRFPPDARWNPERSVVEFGIGVGEYEGVVRVSRRVFQILLPEALTPERCLEAYYLSPTRLELIRTEGSPQAVDARRQCRNHRSRSAGRESRRIHAVTAIAGPLHESGGSNLLGMQWGITAFGRSPVVTSMGRR
jgi:hypothetical protein